MTFGWLLQVAADPSASPINVTVTVSDSGWSILAAIAQAIAAFAILGTLVIFGLQLRTMRGQAGDARNQLEEMQRQGTTSQGQLNELRQQGEDARRRAEEDRHSAVTPMLWITVGGVTSGQGSPNVQASIFLHVDGTGIAFAVSPGLIIAEPTEAARMVFQISPGPYTISAPNVQNIPVSWIVPAHLVKADVEVNFDNQYNRHFRWRQAIRILPEKQIELVGAPRRESVDRILEGQAFSQGSVTSS